MSIDQEQKFGMVVPNGKHIKKAIMDMLDEKGYEWEAWQNGLLHLDIKNEPVTLTFQHQVDVIDQVSKKIFAGGWVGSERLAEHYAFMAKNGLYPEVVEIGRFRLFPSRLRLGFLVRDNDEDNEKYKTPVDLRRTRVVTGTPTLAAIHLATYFPGEDLPVKIDKTNGGEEGQVYARVAGAALVVIDSGDTMRRHYLRELKGGTFMRGIYASAIANIEYLQDGDNRKLLEQAMGRLQNGRRSKTGFLMPKLPGFSEVVAVTPGSEMTPAQLLIQDVPGDPVSDGILNSDKEPARSRWDSVRRFIPGLGKTAVASAIFVALLGNSAMYNPEQSTTSTEKDVQS